MKRKAEKQQPAAPVSAFAARKARLQQAQTVVSTEKTTHTEVVSEPPSKRPRRSLEEETPTQTVPEEQHAQRPKKRGALTAEEVAQKPAVAASRKTREANLGTPVVGESEDQASSDEGSEGEYTAVEENNGTGVMAVPDTGDGYESPTDTAVTVEFPLSKIRLNKSNIVYADEHTLCARIREKMNLVLIGHYDLWVKRGVISLMGAKLHPSPRVYRVYAPSTHSLPVVKCVSGVDGAAEVEFKSCRSGINRLRDLSPLYERIWNSKNTAADRLSLKNVKHATRRTFSVLYTSADDALNRHLRPLHLEKQWSTAIKTLSQRGGRLQVLVCGPKASGKSTFGRYLLNHLLSPAPQTESNYYNTDGVAFLDLDPGQPEFSPMGQIYLAHLRSPVFGPPFTHPSLDSCRDASAIVRAHHIGATSPKEDPDHYVVAAMNLMEHYRALLATYPQCPLIINYPGWIFGLGLEVATYLVRSLGLSDVVYMSEKGPMEVVEPLGHAARAARVPLTILPSQPTEFVSRSSAQLRSMQMQSYFHMSHPQELNNPVWLESPISRVRPFRVHYTGPQQGIHGIMVLGSQISPDLLCESLEGAIVGVVAVESPNAIPGLLRNKHNTTSPDDASDIDMEMDNASATDDPTTTQSPSPSSTPQTILTTTTTRTKENLPYLSPGTDTGSTTPVEPKSSHSLGLALIRSVNTTTHQIELVTPIPAPRIRSALEHGHAIVLVRGLLDNPNWAISEEYHAARAAERRFRLSMKKDKRKKSAGDEKNQQQDAAAVLSTLKERTRRAKNVPWMTVLDGRRQRDAVVHREGSNSNSKALWKLRKKAYPDSGSDGEFV